MPVAGIGSRFVALLVDYLLWFGAALLIIFAISLVDPSLAHFSKLGQKWAVAVFIFIPFLLYWGYFTLFEALWDGRTPGKRVAKIRVIQRSGRGIGFFESMTRNFLRIVDQFPFVYAVGAVSIFLTSDHQRLGDLAAGTLVVHERENMEAPSAGSSTRTLTAGIFSELPARRPVVRMPGGFEVLSSGVQRLGAADLEVLEGFFARRLDFSIETRAMLAERIAGAIRAKAGLESPPGVSTESYLEEIARQLRDSARMG